MKSLVQQMAGGMALLWLGIAVPQALAAQPVIEWEGRTMGTFYSVRITGLKPEQRLLAELRAAVDQRLAAINRSMSHYLPDSELSLFNGSTSTAPFRVSTELARVTRYAVQLHQETGGAFDPTLGVLINLWGFGPVAPGRRVPSREQIAASLRQCGARHLRVTAQDEIQKTIPTLQLNLSAIAKGYGADEAVRVLGEHGCTNVFVSVGGEIVTRGLNPEGQPWQVGIERPQYGLLPGAALSVVVPLSGRALSTSGDSHNYFRDEQGRVFGHILDPATGWPVQNGLASVTVIAPCGLTADGLATALYVLGLDRGLRWVEAHPDIAALFITRSDDSHLRLSPSTRFPVYRAVD